MAQLFLEFTRVVLPYHEMDYATQMRSGNVTAHCPNIDSRAVTRSCMEQRWHPRLQLAMCMSRGVNSLPPPLRASAHRERTAHMSEPHLLGSVKAYLGHACVVMQVARAPV